MVSFCGNTEALGDGSASLKLPTNRPLILIRDALPGHGRDEIALWVKEAYRRIGTVCNFAGRFINVLAEATPQDIIHIFTVDDLGSGGVLADQQMPYTGAKQLICRINNRVKWFATDGQMPAGTIDPVRTLTHESIHFCGLGHLPSGPPPDLMEPTVSQTIIGPQATEAKILAGWFGPPLAQPGPQPTPSGWIAKTFYIPSTGIPAGPQKIVPWTG